jgi:hypothetical protein
LGPKRDEVTGSWQGLHNKEIHNLYSSPSIIRLVKSGRVRWAEYVVRIGANRNACEFWRKNHKERENLEDIGVARWILLNCIRYILSHIPRMCGVTNNTTRVRIGYRIYSLWRFTAAHVTITDY